MENFDIAKYLKEHQLGSYGILNHYIDMKPLKEEEDEVELNAEVPYEGPEDKLTGMGDGDNFNQAETVSEELENGEMEEEWNPNQPTNQKKFIGRLPNSMRNQSIVDKIMDVLNAAGISREDFKAFIDAVKTDPDALPLE